MQLQTAHRVHVAEGGIRCEHELSGAEHQLDDPRRRRPHDEQAFAGGVVHGLGRRKLSQFCT